MRLTFKDRIAFYYILASAIIIAFVFIAIYFTIEKTVYYNIDNDLSFEAEKHTHEILLTQDSIFFKDNLEWEEKEHINVEVNPVFLQLINRDGHLMDKSPNLKTSQLSFNSRLNDGLHFNEELNQKPVRQIQMPILQNGNVKGYILVAMSMESSLNVLNSLEKILFILYPFVLFGLFFISRFIAGRSIIPIQNIIKTTNKITKNNLQDRVELPAHNDELFQLSSAINDLLNRIEKAIVRERHFTSDASHELRTPLASMRGNLEVLIRKQRNPQEYVQQIKSSLLEIDKMSKTIEQLLFLARFDSLEKSNNSPSINLITLVDDILVRNKESITNKNIRINLDATSEEKIMVPEYYTSLILENIISNAVKYSLEDSIIDININETSDNLICVITDYGIGIKREDLKDLFQPFFRSDALNHKKIAGNGLGLSIAQKAAEAINAKITVESKLNLGSTFTIIF